MPSKPLSELDPDLRALKHQTGESFGLWFNCPACAAPGHTIFVPIRGVSPFKSGLWHCADERLEWFTVSPSIDLSRPPTDESGQPLKHPKTGEPLQSSCSFHGFVENGVVRW